MTIRLLLPTLLLPILFCTCGPASPETAEAPVAPVVPAPPAENEAIAPSANLYKASGGEFLGMKTGEPLAPYIDVLRKGVLSTGEGDFDIYYIDGAEGDELGFIFPSYDESNSIGDICITSPNVMTDSGLSVGMTYADLQEKLGEVEVHGSEIEGYTHASKDGYSYRLDAGNWSYEIDPTTINSETKIIEIILP